MFSLNPLMYSIDICMHKLAIPPVVLPNKFPLPNYQSVYLRLLLICHISPYFANSNFMSALIILSNFDALLIMQLAHNIPSLGNINFHCSFDNTVSIQSSFPYSMPQSLHLVIFILNSFIIHYAAI